MEPRQNSTFHLKKTQKLKAEDSWWRAQLVRSFYCTNGPAVLVLGNKRWRGIGDNMLNVSHWLVMNMTQFLQGSSYNFLHVVMVLTDVHMDEYLDFKPQFLFVCLRILCYCVYIYIRYQTKAINETDFFPSYKIAGEHPLTVYTACYSRYHITVNNNNHFRS